MQPESILLRLKCDDAPPWQRRSQFWKIDRLLIDTPTGEPRGILLSSPDCSVFNEKEYERLKSYAELEGLSMAEVLRDYIKTLMPPKGGRTTSHD